MKIVRSPPPIDENDSQSIDYSRQNVMKSKVLNDINRMFE